MHSLGIAHIFIIIIQYITLWSYLYYALCVTIESSADFKSVFV